MRTPVVSSAHTLMATPLQNGPAGHSTDHEPALVRFGKKFTESRYFMVSLLVHVILVIIAGTIVLFRTPVPVEDFVSAGAVPGADNTTDPVDQTAEKPPEVLVTPPQRPDTGGNPIEGVTTPSSILQVPVSAGTSVGPIILKPPGAIGAGLGNTLNVPGKIGVPGAFGGRFDDKLLVGKPLGLKDKSLLAVQRSLKWLRENQNSDGSWGETNKSAMTGLALLCYLGFGELPGSADYGLTINRAVQWLLENGARFEGRLNMEKTFTQHGVYEHGIATYALGEYVALTHDDRATYVFTQAVAHIVQGQGPGGGWMYGFDKTADDLSVSGWQIQALKAAHLTGLKLPGVDAALDKAVSHIERVRGPRGGYGYRGPEDRYSLTGVGILAKLFWKGEKAELRQGMDWLITETEKNHPVKYKGTSADLYAWYYHTQACLMFGGPAWVKWNLWFQDEICDAQSPDGSWPVPGGRSPGPQAAQTITGAVYRTTLCTLMLEVYYRYSAVHQK